MDVRIGQPSSGPADEISALALMITDLALRSKGYWGYDNDFLEACRDELTCTPQDCTSGDLFVGRVGADLVGFGMVRGGGGQAELSALFVDLPWIGRGVGRRLLDHAHQLARHRGARRLGLDADPGAEAFYLRHRARRVGSSPSGSIPGRVLPRLEFDLTDSQ